MYAICYSIALYYSPRALSGMSHGMGGLKCDHITLLGKANFRLIDCRKYVGTQIHHTLKAL